MTVPLDAVRDLLDRRMPALVVPGVALGIVHEGREEAAYAGVTSVADPLPVDDGTLFQIGSGPSTGSRVYVLRAADGSIEWIRFGLRLYAPESRAHLYPAHGGGLVT